MAGDFVSTMIQQRLGVEVDGQYGPATEAALKASLKEHLPKMGRPWGKDRMILAFQQKMMAEAGLNVDVDGVMGPETRDAIERWQNLLKAKDLPKAATVESPKEESWWRRILGSWLWDETAAIPEGQAKLDKVALPKSKPPAVNQLKFNEWPTQKEVEGFYGAKGSRQTRIALPFEMELAWDAKTKVTTMVCHEQVAPSVQRILTAVKEHYGDEGIKALGLHKYGGCLNVRKMTGGQSWSMHSWGIAIDFDPDRNQFRWDHQKAKLASDDAKKFWEFWETEGWVSLGRARDYDWMHVQAARL